MQRETVQFDLTDGAAGSQAGAGVAGRTLRGRRRMLPPGRAVAGGFLVALAAVVAFSAVLSSTGSRGTRWAVAARPLGAGTVLGPGDLTTATMRLSGPAAASAFNQMSSLVGRTLAVGVQPGQLLESPLLVPSGHQPALRPVSVAVDPTSVAGLTPGDAVDVLETAGGGAAGGPTTVSVVMRGATLIDSSTAGSDVVDGTGATEVTLGVATLSEVEAVVGASRAGTLTIVAAERSDGVGPGAG